MPGWAEYGDVVERAERVIQESIRTRRLAKTFVERVRERRSLDASPDLADRRLGEMNELIANLNKRLESQPVIEQAKGILMAGSHCSPDEAFDMLRRLSMRTNRKLRDVAGEIVAANATGRGLPDHPA